MTGVDISHYQTITDYGALAKAAEFVILKATEGTGYRDPTYTPRIATLRVQRAKVGAYHFASTGAALAEAEAFLAYAKPMPGDLLALDVEAGILTRLPGQQLVTWCRQWLDRVRAKTGITPHIYMSLSVVQGRDWSTVAATYPLWLAAYMTSMPKTKWWSRPAIWQYTSTGRIAGIKGDVDLDRVIAAPKPAPTKPNSTIQEDDDMPTAQEVANALLNTKITVTDAANGSNGSTSSETVRDILARLVRVTTLTQDDVRKDALDVNLNPAAIAQIAAAVKEAIK